MKKLLALVVAGVAIKFFLESEQGKDIKNKIISWLDDLEASWDNQAPAATQKIEQMANSTDNFLPKMDS
jgi:hypothetical protein